MLRYSFSMPLEAGLIEKAVAETLKEGFRTQDIHQQKQKTWSAPEKWATTLQEICVNS